MKIEVTKDNIIFEEGFNHILESENPVALSYDNYEALSELIENKCGFIYDDILYRDACNKALKKYEFKQEIFDVDYDVNLYIEYKKIHDNGFVGVVPEEDSNLYKFSTQFDPEFTNNEFDYSNEYFVMSITSFMYSRLYETEVKSYVNFIESLEYGFTNEDEKLSKFALEEIATFAINPWIEKSGYSGIVGEEDIEYKLDELVAQSYCKCDYQTALSIYKLKQFISDGEDFNYDDNINESLESFKILVNDEESKDGQFYSEDLRGLAVELYYAILDYDVKSFIEKNN